MHTAATATHFQQVHKQLNVGGPPRPHSTQKNWMAAQIRNFQTKITRFGRPVDAQAASQISSGAHAFGHDCRLRTSFLHRPQEHAIRSSSKHPEQAQEHPPATIACRPHSRQRHGRLAHWCARRRALSLLNLRTSAFVSSSSLNSGPEVRPRVHDALSPL